MLVVEIEGRPPQVVTAEPGTQLPLPNVRAIVLRNGDLFERDLKTGALTQILRGTTPIGGLAAGGGAPGAGGR